MLTDATEMNTPNVCASLACSSPSHCSGAGALMSRGLDRLDAVGAIICLIGIVGDEVWNYFRPHLVNRCTPNSHDT